MAADHTAGPWSFRAQGEANTYAIFDAKGEWLLAALHNGHPMTAKQEANLRLMAAAPELLEFAQLAYDYLTGKLDQPPMGEARLAAIIAKATRSADAAITAYYTDKARPGQPPGTPR
jgi:hypothetical protein